MTKMSPFEALYGYPPPMSKEYVINSLKFTAMKDYLATFNEVISTFKSHLEQERNHTNQETNTKIINQEFEVGDCMFVPLQPYK